MANATNIIGLKELRENTQKYISQIARGKTFTVVRRSKPIFRITPVDIWGDGDGWETVIDFLEITPSGVPLDDVIKTLKKVNG